MMMDHHQQQQQQQHDYHNDSTTVEISDEGFSTTSGISFGLGGLGPSSNNNTTGGVSGSYVGSGGGGSSGGNNKVKFSSDTSLASSYGLKYEYFPGKNNFYCGGRLMTAPKLKYCILNFLLISGTFGLFMAFDSPFLYQKVHLTIPVVASLLFICVIANMIRTTFSDPGIIPRASAHESEFLDKLYSVSTGDSTTFRPPPRTKDVLINGSTVKSKYCFTCKMFRPPRASHCGTCDNCVERFDHHCPMLGNCIGKRNYRSFYSFVVSLSCLAVVVLCGSVAHLALLSRDDNMLAALRESPASAVVIIVSFFGMWTILGLAGFHTYLICVEQTTNEDIKGIFGRENAKNPYSHGGYIRNCCHILCGPTSPSIIDPRGIATSEFIESLPHNQKSAVLSGSTSTVMNTNKSSGVCRRTNNGDANINKTGAAAVINSPRDQTFKQSSTFESNNGLPKNFNPRNNIRMSPSNNGGLLNTSMSPSNNGMISTTNTSRFISSPPKSSNGVGFKAGTFPDADKQLNKIESLPLNNKYSSSKLSQRVINPSSNGVNNVTRIGVANNGLSSSSGSSSSSPTWSSSGLNNGHHTISTTTSSPSNRLNYPNSTITDIENEVNRRNQTTIEPEHVVLIKNSTSANKPKNNDGNNYELENMTMINSPLHLDSIAD